MKGGYGKALRNYAGKLRTVQMIDFGDLPVFDEATTYPSVWLLKRENVKSNNLSAAIMDTLVYPNGMDYHLKNRWIQVNGESLTDDSWNLVDYQSQQLLSKVKAVGTPLANHLNGKIYYGIKTGYNEAFVIDTITKEGLIEKDLKSADLIKPFLAGRDIKRYRQPVHDKWIILIPNGLTRKYFGKIAEPLAWDQFSVMYPAICDFLEPHATKAKARSDKGEYWWELRPCDYYAEFESPKIFYQEIASYSTFVYDRTGLYSNNKLFFIPTDDLSLLGFLNSKLVWFYLKNTANGLRGALALQSPYILNLPFSDALKGNDQIRQLVSTVLHLKQNMSQESTADLEAEIDQLIYGLYNLTKDDIALIERASLPF